MKCRRVLGVRGWHIKCQILLMVYGISGLEGGIFSNLGSRAVDSV
jgi:hypothetical protein